MNLLLSSSAKKPWASVCHKPKVFYEMCLFYATNPSIISTPWLWKSDSITRVALWALQRKDNATPLAQSFLSMPLSLPFGRFVPTSTFKNNCVVRLNGVLLFVAATKVCSADNIQIALISPCLDDDSNFENSKRRRDVLYPIYINIGSERRNIEKAIRLNSRYFYNIEQSFQAPIWMKLTHLPNVILGRFLIFRVTNLSAMAVSLKSTFPGSRNICS